MSIIRYTPIQDAFIVSGSVGETLNTGLDQILQLGHSNRVGVDDPSRILLGFGKIVVPASMSKATLHLYTANACNLPLPDYTIKACPISESWEEGYGKFYDERTLIEAMMNRVFDNGYASTIRMEDIINGGDSSWIIPTRTINATEETVGVSWKYRTYLQDPWQIAGGDMSASQSYVSQSFSRGDNKDINLDVTSLLQSESCDNGFIIAFSDEARAAYLSSSLMYYSKDTHTIYRPYLQIEIDDAEYDSELEAVETEQINISTEGLKSEYSVGDITRLGLRVNPKYSIRAYTSGPIYSSNWILPEESYWGVKDERTGEMIIDFCEGTKISADNRGSYFDLNVNVLEPERYYRLVYEVNLDSRTIVFDNKNIFKVVRNG